MKKIIGLGLFGLMAGLHGFASPLNVAVTGDRWMYPFNSSPGTRASASVFGAPGNPGFDERDAQFLMYFDTGAQVVTGQGASNYVVHSATLRLRHSGASFVYDPTSDVYTTYLDAAAPGYTADGDAGRPIELFGVGYRGGYDSATFSETSPFGPPGPPASGVRFAYAAGFNGLNQLVDVSNSLDHLNDGAAGFDPQVFAVGIAPGLSAGDVVSAGGQDFLFSLDLSNPNVVGYLQDQLNQGRLSFAATSFHEATFGGSPAYPIFETGNNLVGQAAELVLDVSVIPEPGVFTMALMGLGAVLYWHRRRGRS